MTKGQIKQARFLLRIAVAMADAAMPDGSIFASSEPIIKKDGTIASDGDIIEAIKTLRAACENVLSGVDSFFEDLGVSLQV